MRILAVISEVGSQVVIKEPSLRCWRIKWCRTSMCLVLEEMTSVLAIVHVLWLSQYIGKGMGAGNDVRVRNNFIQIASFMVLVSA